MATKTEKKNKIRQGIIESAEIYSKMLAGKVFLYVYGEEYFEVSFPLGLSIVKTIMDRAKAGNSGLNRHSRLSYSYSRSQPSGSLPVQ